MRAGGLRQTLNEDRSNALGCTVLAAGEGTESGTVAQTRGLLLSLLLLAIPAGHLCFGQGTAASLHLDAALLPGRDTVAPQTSNTALNVTWAPVAPTTYSTAATGAAGGRILSVAVDPADPSGNTVYLGTSGGVWKSTNAAGSPASVTFAPLTDAVPALNGFGVPATVISVGSVSVQPGGTGVVLAGTGDATNRTDSIYGTGLLRSADGGRSWTAIPGSVEPGTQQRQSFFGEAFSGFAWSTVSPNLVVAAVASAGGAFAANAGDSNQSAMGLYYSHDAGQSWQFATITDGPNQEIQGPDIGVGSGAPVVAVVWNPVRRLFLAAIRLHGFYQSADGVTWTRLATQPGTALTSAVCPADSGGGGNALCPLYQATLAVQPSTGDTFAMFTNAADADEGLWQDICAAANGTCATPSPIFAHRVGNAALETSAGVIAGASHALSLQALPAGADTVLLAGTRDLFRCSLAAGCTWRNATNVSGCAAAQVGAMQHQAAWVPNSSTLYFATDRGLWRSTDAVNQQAVACSADDAAHFQNLNASLGAIAEVTSLAQDPVDATAMLAGEGSLGTAGGSNGAWRPLLTGTGAGTAVGTGATAGTWFATSGAGVSISACGAGAGCAPGGFGTQPVIGNTQVSGDGTALRQPAVWMLDPQDPSRMIVGTCRTWRGPASGLNWAPSNALSTMLDGHPAPSCQSGNAQIRSLAATGTLSGTNTERIYAGLAGVPDGVQIAPGHIYSALVTPASTAASTHWSDLTANPLTNGVAGSPIFNSGLVGISAITIDPTAPSTLYVGIGGYGGYGFAEFANVSPVYRSTDAGQHWTNITSNLPIAPVNAILVDPLDPAIVYLATDVGVYVTTTITLCGDPTQACWGAYGAGLPAVKVTSLAASAASGNSWLRVGTWGRGIWQTELASAALQQAALLAATLTPSSLSFAPQAVGTVSAAQTLTLQNTGQGAVTLGTPVVSAQDFSVSNGCGSTLAQGASCTLSVVFAPTATGGRSATVSITTNTPSGTLMASLDGTGLQGSTIVLTPLRLDFGAVLLGQTSPVQYMTIANTGTAAATLQSPHINGPFRITADTCSATLPVNTSCTVGIAFSPVASGVFQGAISVTDSAGTQTALLSGTGQTGPSDTLSTSSLTFAPQQLGTTSAQQQVVITNSGDTALNGIVASVTGDFLLVNQCGTSLPGHSTCALLVAYAPQALGAETGQLVLVDQQQQQVNRQTVVLNGTGTPPPVAPPGSGLGILTASPLRLDFGLEGVNASSAPQTVTLINSGAAVLSGISIASGTGFSVSANACTGQLSPGASCTFAVIFSPQSPGAVQALLQVSAATLVAPTVIPVSGTAADFQLSVQGSSSSTVIGGATATYQLLLTPVGASAGQVAIGCTGAPQGSTCTANPSMVTMDGSGATATITVTVATPATTAASLATPRQPWPLRAWPAAALLIPLLWGGSRRGRTLGQCCAVLAVGVICLGSVGCGLTIHGGGAAHPAASGPSAGQGTFNVTVGATAPGLVRTVSLNLVVE